MAHRFDTIAGRIDKKHGGASVTRTCLRSRCVAPPKRLSAILSSLGSRSYVNSSDGGERFEIDLDASRVSRSRRQAKVRHWKRVKCRVACHGPHRGGRNASAHGAASRDNNDRVELRQMN